MLRWGTRVKPETVSNINKKIYKRTEGWRNRPIEGDYPYVYLDSIVLKRRWGGEVRNISVLVAIGVNEDGFGQVPGVVEGVKRERFTLLHNTEHCHLAIGCVRL